MSETPNWAPQGGLDLGGMGMDLCFPVPAWSVI